MKKNIFKRSFSIQDTAKFSVCYYAALNIHIIVF